MKKYYSAYHMVLKYYDTDNMFKNENTYTVDSFLILKDINLLPILASRRILNQDEEKINFD